MNNKLPTYKKSDRSPVGKFATDCSQSLIIAVVAAATLLSIGALFLANADIPHSLLEPITTILTAMATFISTYISGTAKKEQTLGHGLTTGGIMFALVFILSLIFGDGEVTYQTLIKLVAYLSAGGIGSAASARARTAKKTKLRI